MPAKLTTDMFIEKAKAIYGDFYDYSDVQYKTSKSSVTIVCPIHGRFTILPNSFLNGRSCTECKRDKKESNRMKAGRLAFIEKAAKNHDEKYDYSKVEYTTTHDKVEIICPMHGSFFQTPNSHLRGSGCPECGEFVRHEKRKLSLDEFISRSNASHDGKYDYTNVKYVNSGSKVEIICPIHGSFFQTPYHHYRGSGCWECKSSKAKNTMVDRYGYDNPNRGHLSHGTISILNDKDELQKLSDTLSIFEISEYLGMTISPIYKVFAKFGIKPNTEKRQSSQEKKLVEMIQNMVGEEGVVCSDRTVLDGNRELDIFIPSHNIAIEYNGVYWHSELFRDRKYHQKKSLDCSNKGIQLIHVWEDDWMDDRKRSILHNRISRHLGLGDHGGKIYGRDTYVDEAIPFHEIKQLVDDHHIQGYIPSRYIGLRSKETDFLVAAMGVKNIGVGVYDITRFVTSCHVLGGFSKLLSHFKKSTDDWSKVITYAHMDYSQGKMYETVGFTKKHITTPGMWYVKNGKRYRREKFMKHKLKDLLDTFDPDRTESYNMKNNGFLRLYDAGSIRFELTR